MTLNELKDLITSKIKTNGNRSITGISLQNVLSSIVNYASNAVRADDKQTYTSSEQSQARKNIGAVGVAPVDGNNVLEYNGKTIYPRTSAEMVTTKSLKTVEDALSEKVGIATSISDGGVVLMDKNGQTVYPMTKLKFIDNSIGKHSRYGQSSEAVLLIDGSTDEIVYPETKTTYVKHKSANLETVINILDSRSQETKEKVDTFLADADTSAKAIDKLKELQEYIKSDETSASQMLGDIAQNRQDIAKEAQRAQQTEMYLESQKANKTGYYENLSVGVADNLVGRGEATERVFNFSPSGGVNKSIKDGTARITSIQGNSVVWNKQGGIKGGSIGVANASSVGEFANQTTFIKGHIYLVISNLIDGTNEASDGRIDIYTRDNNTNKVIKSLKLTDSNYAIFESQFNAVSGKSAVEGSAWLFCVYRQAITQFDIFDLTKMFSAGNEPTTLEEFESLCGNMPNEYNEGAIIDNHTTAIKSVGFNQFNGEYAKVLPNKTYYLGGSYTTIGFTAEQGGELEDITIPENKLYTPTKRGYIYASGSDICINLSHTGYRDGEYRPYESSIRQLPTVEGGLKSAGTAYDEIRYNVSKDKYEHVKRVGSVDLGDLVWTISVDKRFTSSDVVDMKGVSANIAGNMLCAKYTALPANNTYKGVTGISQSERHGGYFHIWDASYTEASALQQDLRGVICYYELIEPIITELDTDTIDFNGDYEVWDFGTEESVVEKPSTPFKGLVKYGFNAVDQIRNNEINIEALLARVAQLEAKVSQINVTNEEV